MALFGFGKKKEEATACCCGSTSAPEVKATTTGAAASEGCCCGDGDCTIKSIKVLGAGCKNCHALNEASIAAVKELGMDLEVEYITDMEKIMSYGAMRMPVLVVNEKVVSTGKVLKSDEIIQLLKKNGYC